MMGDKPTGIYPLTQFATPWDPDRDDTRTGIVGVQDTRCLRDDSDSETDGKDRIWTLWTSFSQLESVQFDIGWEKTEGTGTDLLRKKEAYAWGMDFEQSANLFQNNQWAASSCQGLEEFDPGMAGDLIFGAESMFQDTSCSSACIGVDLDGSSTAAVGAFDYFEGNFETNGFCYNVPLWNSIFKNEDSFPSLPVHGTAAEYPVQNGGNECGLDFGKWHVAPFTDLSTDNALGGASPTISSVIPCTATAQSVTTWWAGAYSDSSCVDKQNGAPCGPKGLDRCINSGCVSTRCDFTDYYRAAQVVGHAETPCTTAEWSFVGKTGRCYVDAAGANLCGEILDDCASDGSDAGMPCDKGVKGWCQTTGFTSAAGAAATYDCFAAVRDCKDYPELTRCTYAGANRNELGWCTGTGIMGTGYNTCAGSCTGTSAFASFQDNGTTDDSGAGFGAAIQSPGNRACMLTTACATEIQTVGTNEWGLLSEETELRFGYCIATGCAVQGDSGAVPTAIGGSC